jgi:hypothetical protein
MNLKNVKSINKVTNKFWINKEGIAETENSTYEVGVVVNVVVRFTALIVRIEQVPNAK